MKSLIKFFTAALLVTACGSGISVTSDYDKSYDFVDAKTAVYFGWSDGTDKILSPFDKERIETAFKNEFKERGITFTKNENADIIVSLHIVTQKKQETTATTTGTGMGYGGYYGYGPGYGWGGGMSSTTYSTYDYTVGTLLVSVHDVKEKRLVWESAGSGTINEKTEGREDRINYAVKQIMYKYPVKPLPSK